MLDNHPKALLTKNKKRAKITALTLAALVILIFALFIMNVALK